MGSTVLITGVSRYLGARCAAELARRPGVDRVIGVDVVSPTWAMGEAEFVRADIRNPVVARIMAEAQVDTVVHLSVSTSPGRGSARISQKEVNVLGTMQLLAACQNTPSVRRLVVKSTGAVYGSSPRDPALFSEDDPTRPAHATGFVKDSLEVEGYVRGLRRRRPELSSVLLRMAHVVGPRIETPLTDHFRRPVVVVPLGYDARLQLLHEDDAVEAIVVAALGETTGVVNVAGDGVLTLTQAAATVRRLPLPVPVSPTGLLAKVGRPLLGDLSGEQVDFLLWGRAMNTRRMRSELRFDPAYTTRAAFEDFAATVPDLPAGGLARAGVALLPASGRVG